jgi:hypothetical protein
MRRGNPFCIGKKQAPGVCLLEQKAEGDLQNAETVHKKLKLIQGAASAKQKLFQVIAICGGCNQRKRE